MKKTLPLLSLTLLLTGLFPACTNRNAEFPPGPTDARLTGTWQLYERRFSKDSTYTIRIKRDSLAIVRDTSRIKSDSIYLRRDTTFYTTRRYSGAVPQTLSLDTDGKLTYAGTEMTYYAPYQHYRLDKAYPDSLLIDLIIYTNGANITVRQGLEFRRDTLVLKPRCDQPCYSKLLRTR